MKRHFPSWLHAFTDYASYGEAPRNMYLWVGVAAIAGALRRCVWLDQKQFQWVPNFYVILVAPAGIVSKTTTADIGMKILQEVPGIHFGPQVVTWQALTQAMAQSNESIEMPDKLFHPMSALTLSSGEIGNLLDPSDREMVDILVTLWDSRQGIFTKLTKTQGQDDIVNPCLNIIACTTPSWIAGNFPEYMIGGGFTSRCIFVYTDKKFQYTPYLDEAVPKDYENTRQKLLEDLITISLLRGEYVISESAREWGRAWYINHHQNRPKLLDNDRFGGYIARKQTHIHKLAMIIAASKRQELIIELDDLVEANILVSTLEENMPKVFDKIGVSENAKGQSELVSIVRSHGIITNDDLYKQLFRILSYEDFCKSLQSAIAAKFITQFNHNGQLAAKAIYDPEPTKKSDSDGITKFGDGTPLARANG